MPLENLEAVLLTSDESLFMSFRTRFLESGVSLAFAPDNGIFKKLLVKENVKAVILDSAHTDRILGMSTEQAVVKMSPLLKPRVMVILGQQGLPQEQIVKLLKMGAHDVVTMPVSPRILAEQLKALVRVFSLKEKRNKRILSSPSDLLIMDYPRRRCYIKIPDGEPPYLRKDVRLTKIEFQILYFLLRKKGAVVTYEDFREHLWPTACSSKEIIHTLHQLIANIRKKIVPCPVKIENLRAEGFRIVSPLPERRT